MIEVVLAGIGPGDNRSQGRLLLLRETSGEGRVLPIIIADPEAQSIYLGMEGLEVARPLTHDLTTEIIAELGASLVRAAVTDLHDRTFLAEIEVEINGEHHVISARPSDAVALAVRANAPIFASEHVLDEAGQVIDLEPAEDAERGEDVDPDELLDEFKQFLADVSPGDFGATGTKED